jgi:hypothetical protein
VVSTSEPADIISFEIDGKKVADTKKERIEEKKKWSDLVEKHFSDLSVEAMVDSYHAAVMDHDNELIHLYEIFDACDKKTKKGIKLLYILEISEKETDHFKDLANRWPIKQGRHRGVHYGKLRDATAEELNEARTYARKLIEKYLLYLEKNSSK